MSRKAVLTLASVSLAVSALACGVNPEGPSTETSAPTEVGEQGPAQGNEDYTGGDTARAGSDLSVDQINDSLSGRGGDYGGGRGDNDDCDDDRGGRGGKGPLGWNKDGLDLDLDADIDICGTVKAFAKATADVGLCQIGPMRFPIAQGTKLVGEALLAVNANVCIRAKLDIDGKIKAPSKVRLNILGKASVHACGTVKAFVNASLDSKGLIDIGHYPFEIAAGEKVDGDALLKVGAKVCVDAHVNVHGELDGIKVKRH